ncbi:MAG: Uma2 family endonuclease [Bacteroidota bacterium]
MTAIITSNTETKPTEVDAYQPRLFQYSLERYHRVIEAGIITENDQVELMHGQIVKKMVIGKRHRDCLDIINLLLVIRFGKDYICSPQNPIIVGDSSEPEPDYAIINRASYAERVGNPEPEDVHLIIEISDATLEYDRTTKAQLYARAGISEYWIIDLRHDKLELYLQPNPEAGVYDSIQRFARDATFTSPFCGDLKVEKLLPPPAKQHEE